MGTRGEGRARPAAYGAVPWFALPLILGIALLLLSPVGSVGGARTVPAAGQGSPIPAGSTTSIGAPRITSSTSSPALGPVATPEWIDVSGSTNANAPPPADSGTMAYYPEENETVYFGGCTPSQCPENLTWVFSNGEWTNITNPFDAPPARDDAVMDYDPNMQGILLFGGVGATSNVLGDTWLFQDGIWTNLTWVGPGPTPRYGASLAFDPDPEENGSVLFGGYSGTAYLNDTWIWEGWSGWVALTTTTVSPPESEAAMMTYDAADQCIVLFGAGFSSETWELYSGQWWQILPGGTIPYNVEAAMMIYDPAVSAVVLFGGVFFIEDFNYTFEFSQGTWTNISSTVAPSPRDSGGIALDPTGSVPLLYGGYGPNGDLNDTWVFEAPPSVALTASPTADEVSAAVTLTASVSGGTSPYRATFDFGDNTSSLVTSTGGTLTATHVYEGVGAYDPTVSVTDSIGAVASATGPAVKVAKGLRVVATANPTSTDIGIPLSFVSSLNATGTPPVNYTWHFGDGASAYGKNASHAYSAAGSYSVNVTAVDSLGSVSTATLTVSVHPRPLLSVAASPSSAPEGSPVVFYANATGGTAPYQYSWRFGDGTSSSFAAPAHTFPAAGTYTVEVWVNDSVGASTHQTMTYVVGSPSTSSSGAPDWFWAALAAIIAVGAVGTFLLWRRRRTEPKS